MFSTGLLQYLLARGGVYILTVEDVEVTIFDDLFRGLLYIVGFINIGHYFRLFCEHRGDGEAVIHCTCHCLELVVEYFEINGTVQLVVTEKNVVKLFCIVREREGISTILRSIEADRNIGHQLF